MYSAIQENICWCLRMWSIVGCIIRLCPVWTRHRPRSSDISRPQSIKGEIRRIRPLMVSPHNGQQITHHVCQWRQACPLCCSLISCLFGVDQRIWARFVGYLYSEPIVQSHVALCQLPQLENFVHSLCICVFVKSRYKFNISKKTSVDICVYELSIIPYMLCGISDSNLDKWEHFTSLGGYQNTGNTDWALRFCMRKNWFIHQVKDDMYITGEQSVLEL